MKRLSHTLLLALIATTAHAAVLRVPNHYVTIQSAINAATPGDVVEIAGGTYLEHLSVADKTDLTLRPASGDKVILDAGGSGWPLLIGAPGMVTSKIRVNKLRIRNTSNGSGVWIGHATDVWVDNCEITNVVDGVFSIVSDSVLVRKCKIKSTLGNGIVCIQGDLCAFQNRISSTGANGIQLIGNGSWAMSNTIDHTVGDGVRLGDDSTTTTGCLVHLNSIKNSQGDGVFCTNMVGTASILGNRISRCLDDGIDLHYGSLQCEVAFNNINRCTDGGLEIHSNSHTIRKNKIKRAAIDGIYVNAGSVNSLYEKNKVTKSCADGLEVNGTGNTFTRNKVVGSGLYDLRNNVPLIANTFIANTFGSIAP
ncbi:MAG: right-handed parallel beta-helix repeat-containing protein [Planctomycetota bacterium]